MKKSVSKKSKKSLRNILRSSNKGGGEEREFDMPPKVRHEL